MRLPCEGSAPLSNTLVLVRHNSHAGATSPEVNIAEGHSAMLRDYMHMYISRGQLANTGWVYAETSRLGRSQYAASKSTVTPNS